MLARWLISSSLKSRGLVLAVSVALLVGGVVQFRTMPKDILPEFTPPSVEIQTEAIGLAAAEVEQLVTVPLEQDLLNGVAFLDVIHSQSVPGLSRIQLVFKPGTDLARARQIVNERLTQAAALPHVSTPPQMLQPLSSQNRVMMVRVSSSTASLIDLGVLTRWTLRPRLMGVSGVADVAIWGQRERQIQVQVNPERLAAKGVTLEQVISTAGNSLWWSPLGRLEANTPGSGGFIDGPQQRLGVRHESPIKKAEDLANVAVEGLSDGYSEGALKLGDVATLIEDHQPLIGDAVFADGKGLLLVIEKLPEANVVEVTRDVNETLRALAPGLSGVNIDATIFRPASYVHASVTNVVATLLIGLGLLMLLFLALFSDWRRAIAAAVAVATSFCAAVLVLHARGETVNAMVLGGLVLATLILIDDAVVFTDRRRMRREPHIGLLENTIATALHAAPPIAFATAILALALVPVYVLDGQSGVFLPRVATSYVLAVVASMVAGLTVAPAVGVLLAHRDNVVRGETRVEGALGALHDRGASFVRSPRRALGVLAALVVVGGVAVPFLQRGSSIVAPFKDRNVLVHWEGAPGTSLGEMDRITGLASNELRSLPGVKTVAAHVGRAIQGDQIVSVNAGEIWVGIKGSADYDRTFSSIRRTVKGYPGLTSTVRTYSDERIRQVFGDVRSDLTVRVYGSDLEVLRTEAEAISTMMSSIGGINDVKVVSSTVEPALTVRVNLDDARSEAIKPGDVRRAVTTLISGLVVGSLFEEQKVFDVVVISTPQVRHDLTTIGDLRINNPEGGLVRLADVADLSVEPNVSMIRHEDVSRFVDVTADVRGWNIGAKADAVKAALKKVVFAPDHHAELLGDYEHRQSARWHFIAVTVAAVIGIFLLLQAAFQSWRLALALGMTLPAALAGGAVAALTHRTISVGSLMGFFGVLLIAVRFTVSLVNDYQRLEQGEPANPRIEDIERVTREHAIRVLATLIIACAVFAPFVVLPGAAGYEVAHPMAVVVLGGLVTTTLFSLLVVPQLYVRFRSRPPAAPDDGNGQSINDNALLGGGSHEAE